MTDHSRTASSPLSSAWKGTGTRLARVARPITPLSPPANDHAAADEGYPAGADNCMSLFTQPIVDLATGAIAGYEASLRWFHPTAGELGPEQMIALSNDRRVADRLLLATLAQAADAAASWPEGVFAAIPIPARFLRQPELFRRAEEVLETFALPAGRIHLEVSGEDLVSAHPAARRSLHRLSDLGTTLVLDICGPMQRDLRALETYSFSGIVYDWHLLALSPGTTPKLVQLFDSHAQSRRMSVTAKGLDTSWQVQRAIAAGSSHGQGTWFGRDWPAALLDDRELIALRLGGRT